MVISSILALVLAQATAASATPSFSAYKTACLDTQADPAAIRAAASAAKWQALTQEEKEAIAPGNPDGVEGWAIAQGAGRLQVSIVSGALKGGLASGAQSTCTLTAPQGDDEALIKAYSTHLKRNPSENANDAGLRTAVWSVSAQNARAMHYYFGGAGAAANSSTFSITIIRQQN
ncbi:MAG TPA: hypothetical protein DCL54_13400 [Alphaproteobacteria bacterium]|nr:hypothetical protein [Alphaproteobacteria bacterium]HAJ47565.1 hypothetical protein [Alphaproteobacteria bacterium]